MYRVRFVLPPRHAVRYHHLDVLHDALVQGWVAAGVQSDRVCGSDAAPWNFAALGRHQGKEGICHSLVVSTPSPDLACALRAMEPSSVCYVRAKTGERVNFSAARVQPDPDPLAPGQTRLAVLMLSPLVLREPGTRRWRTDLGGPGLSEAVSARLSRLAGREIRIEVHPDTLYLRANPRHSVLVSLKGGKGHGYVLGMQAPLLLEGEEEDLRYAWYAGIGEKNRVGLGCIGALERGVGR